MAWATGATENIGHGWTDNATLSIQAIGIHLNIIGVKQIVTASVTKLVAVALIGARVFIPVFIKAKLQCIDKD